MFDEMRELVKAATTVGTRLDPSACNGNRVGLAELRRELDSLEAEYSRLAAGVDASWMAQATGSSVQRAKQHAAVGAALDASPALASAVPAGEVGLENVAVLGPVAGHPLFESSPLIDCGVGVAPTQVAGQGGAVARRRGPGRG
jgi:hypothetical protein